MPPKSAAAKRIVAKKAVAKKACAKKAKQAEAKKAKAGKKSAAKKCSAKKSAATSDESESSSDTEDNVPVVTPANQDDDDDDDDEERFSDDFDDWSFSDDDDDVSGYGYSVAGGPRRRQRGYNHREWWEEESRSAPPTDRDVVMFVAPPGSGKSSLARGLQHLLTKHHKYPGTVWINQDECGGQRAYYIGAVARAAADKNVTHIILDKCNMQEQNRSDVEGVMGGCGPTVIFVITHPLGARELANVCISRVASRGKNHKSLTGDDMGTVRRVINSMIDSFDEVVGDETDTVEIDITATPEAQLRAVWEGLKRVGCKKLGDATPAQIAEAVRASKAYESAL